MDVMVAAEKRSSHDVGISVAILLWDGHLGLVV